VAACALALGIASACSQSPEMPQLWGTTVSGASKSEPAAPPINSLYPAAAETTTAAPKAADAAPRARRTARAATPAPGAGGPAETVIAPPPAPIKVESPELMPGREPENLAAAAVPEPAAPPATTRNLAVMPPDHIYSSEDDDVIPARLLTSVPSGTLIRGQQPDMNTMELIVSPNGKVEQVRLLTPAKRMTDMLLLSGAKTWTFAPALQDGLPVRYRTMYSWPSVK
jgi:hypothetical protein